MNITAVINTPTVARQMRRYVTELGLSGPAVIKRQAGLMASTLMAITPPANKSRKAESIQRQIGNKFLALENARSFSEGSGGKEGSGDVRWYAWTSDALFGVARESDMRKASVDDLYKVALTLTPKGKIQAGRRGKQSVLITLRILTKDSTVKAVIKRIQGHIGRGKAGWLPGWKAAGSPGRKPPGWVTTHDAGARGGYVDALSKPESPEFTLENHAYGIGGLARQNGALLNRAVGIRVRAMGADLAFAAAHPDKWREREASLANKVEEAA